MQKLGHPEQQENVYSVPFLANQHKEFVLWFFTGSQCNLECTHCYVESGPKADKHPFLTFKTFKEKLNEAEHKNYSKLEIYFTGGEPFLNPDFLSMLELSLKYGETTVLSNGTRITDDITNQLGEMQQGSKNKITIRLSLDGPDEKSNDKIRGPKAFERAIRGFENLLKYDIKVIVTAMRSWSLLHDGKMRDQFIDLVKQKGIIKAEENFKILPPLRIGREVQRDRPYTQLELFTDECFADYDYNNLQCSKCRMVSENGVYVCPILINVDNARMGQTLEESERPYQMKDMACWTCRMDGMSCTND
ncbi:MAG: radical SAM protein [Candidatus Kariarchaeaceae archaeon]